MIESDILSQINKFANARYLDIPRQFSADYGNGQSLTSHLTSPIGRGALSRAGVVPVGLGIGVGLAKANPLKTLLGGDELPFGVLPTLSIGINTGFAFTSNWDVRLSYFPISDFNLPSFGEAFSYRIKSSVIRVATNYRLFGQDRSIFGFGLTLGAYFAYSTGALAFNENIPSVSLNSAGSTIELAFSGLQFNSKWLYYSGGAELRLDYQLFFFSPYIGIALGIEYGRTDSTVEILVTVNGVIPISVVDGAGGGNVNLIEEKGKILTTGDARGTVLPARIIAGFEFNLYKVSVIIEIQYFVNSSVIGTSFGFNLLI